MQSRAIDSDSDEAQVKVNRERKERKFKKEPKEEPEESSPNKANENSIMSFVSDFFRFLVISLLLFFLLSVEMNTKLNHIGILFLLSVGTHSGFNKV